MAEKWWSSDWQRPGARVAAEKDVSPIAPEPAVRSQAALLDRALAGAAALLCLLLTYVAYGDALHFSFTFDDPLDLPRAEGRSVWSLFTSSEGYAYYRPIPFVLWKILRRVQGHYSEAALHGLTLVCHAAAAWLLYLLLRRLTGGHWGLVASVLFITYPFSYQAAFGAHTLFHPLMTAAILLSLLLYERARTSAAPSTWRAYLSLAGSVLAAAVALWTHESGVIILPLVVGLELLLAIRSAHAAGRSLSGVRPTWWPALHSAATAIFLFAWRTVPKFDRPDPWTRDSLLPNARYFLQGVIWPVAALLKPLGVRFGFDPLGAVWPAIALTLALLVLCYALGRRYWTPLLALSATAIVLVPAWLVLTWAYVEDAPRLLYPAAPAIAALWGLLPGLSFARRWLTVGWRALALLLLGALTLQNLAFIEVRRDMWAEGTKLVHGIADTAAAHEGRPLLYLNVPAWFAPKQPEYPLGHVGLTALPGYVGLGRSVYIHRGIQPPIESRGYYPDLNGWKYDFNTHGGPASLDDFATLLRNVETVYLVEMLPESGARIRDIGGLKPGAANARASGPRFGNSVILSDATIALAGTELEADLTWDVIAPVPGDVLPVLQVRDERGRVVAEWRKYPIGDTAAPRLWRANDRIRDRPILRLPAAMPAGTYTIWLHWEEKTVHALLPGVGTDNAPLPDEGVSLGSFNLP